VGGILYLEIEDEKKERWSKKESQSGNWEYGKCQMTGRGNGSGSRW